MSSGVSEHFIFSQFLRMRLMKEGDDEDEGEAQGREIFSGVGKDFY